MSNFLRIIKTKLDHHTTYRLEYRKQTREQGWRWCLIATFLSPEAALDHGHSIRRIIENGYIWRLQHEQGWHILPPSSSPEEQPPSSQEPSS